MAGLALVVPLLAFMAAATLVAIVWMVSLLLPKSWPGAKRWLVASAIGPSVFGILVLIASGPGLLQAQLAKVLLP